MALMKSIQRQSEGGLCSWTYVKINYKGFKELRIYSCLKVQLALELKARQYWLWLVYAGEIQELANQEGDFIHNHIMGDKAHFN